MNDYAQLSYAHIAQAIGYIKMHFKNQPGLDEVAESISLSPFHFQRLFSDWAGVSPEKFLQYISVGYARQALKGRQPDLFDAPMDMKGREEVHLHNIPIHIESMTPGECKNGGQALAIHYDYAKTFFGDVIIASTLKGVCYMAFEEDHEKAVHDLKSNFPKATLRQASDEIQQNSLSVFKQHPGNLPGIKLHLKGTDFQLKVWKALLRIPMGRLSTYGALAKAIGSPNASRAVGTAIGSNPLAFLIPCHRVIQSGGGFGGYMWGPIRKAIIIGWEAAKTSGE